MYPENFKGAAMKASDNDIKDLAESYGIPAAALFAIREIEAPRGPFDIQGRPTILFEPHKFYAHLTARKLIPQRNRAVKEKLASKSQGAIPYGTYASQYTKLEKAIKIDEQSALLSCSWGSPQILGENHALVGYSAVEHMISDFCRAENLQIIAMCNFIKHVGLIGAIKSNDWAKFARNYNGPAYAKNRYDKKLAEAYHKWQEILSGDGGKRGLFSTTTSDRITNEDAIRSAQLYLTNLGYPTGGIDGKAGKQTRRAIILFQTDNDMEPTGVLTNEVFTRLLSGKPAEIPIERAEATNAHVREKTPEVKSNFIAKVWSGITLAFSAVVAFFEGILQNLDDATSYLDPVKNVLGDVPGWGWAVLAMGVAATIFFASSKGEKAGIEAFKEGRRL